MIAKTLAAVTLVAAALLSAGCEEDSDPPGATPSPAATAQATAPPTIPATAPVAPSPASTAPAASVPAAPSNVQLEGALPDLRTPVPPGQGELGRLLVRWQDNSDNEDGFRLYSECGGAVIQLAEVEAGITSHGPVQTCRPGRLGVAAFNEAGASAIAWTQ